MSTERSDFSEIEATMKRAAAALRNAQVPFALAGSVAGWARGGPETTNDLDFIVTPADAERALSVLADAGMRPERPPEGWLFKAWDDGVLVDLIFAPNGLDAAEVIERAERLSVAALRIPVMSLEDVLVTKLMSLSEHRVDFSSPLATARAVREQVDWSDVRARTAQSPYARAFLHLLEELGIITSHPATRREARVHVVGD
jgi:putative nucleotidyltransferase-like protein